jgi:hypothetical protein
MSILIGNYEFDGPFRNVSDLEEKQGVFAVLHCEDNESYELVHVAESINVREQVGVSQSLYSHLSDSILLAACYTPDRGMRERSAIVSEIESEFAHRPKSTESGSVSDFAQAFNSRWERTSGNLSIDAADGTGLVY